MVKPSQSHPSGSDSVLARPAIVAAWFRARGPKVIRDRYGVAGYLGGERRISLREVGLLPNGEVEDLERTAGPALDLARSSSNWAYHLSSAPPGKGCERAVSMASPRAAPRLFSRRGRRLSPGKAGCTTIRSMSLFDPPSRRAAEPKTQA
jgi:hypothetical protein